MASIVTGCLLVGALAGCNSATRTNPTAGGEYDSAAANTDESHQRENPAVRNRENLERITGATGIEQSTMTGQVSGASPMTASRPERPRISPEELRIGPEPGPTVSAAVNPLKEDEVPEETVVSVAASLNRVLRRDVLHPQSDVTAMPGTGRIVLRGTVTTEQAREQVLEHARRNAQGIPIEHHIAVGTR